MRNNKSIESNISEQTQCIRDYSYGDLLFSELNSETRTELLIEILSKTKKKPLDMKVMREHLHWLYNRDDIRYNLSSNVDLDTLISLSNRGLENTRILQYILSPETRYLKLESLSNKELVDLYRKIHTSVPPEETEIIEEPLEEYVIEDEYSMKTCWPQPSNLRNWRYLQDERDAIAAHFNENFFTTDEEHLAGYLPRPPRQIPERTRVLHEYDSSLTLEQNIVKYVEEDFLYLRPYALEQGAELCNISVEKFIQCYNNVSRRMYFDEFLQVQPKCIINSNRFNKTLLDALFEIFDNLIYKHITERLNPYLIEYVGKFYLKYYIKGFELYLKYIETRLKNSEYFMKYGQILLQKYNEYYYPGLFEQGFIKVVWHFYNEVPPLGSLLRDNIIVTCLTQFTLETSSSIGTPLFSFIGATMMGTTLTKQFIIELFSLII